MAVLAEEKHDINKDLIFWIVFSYKHDGYHDILLHIKESNNTDYRP